MPSGPHYKMVSYEGSYFLYSRLSRSLYRLTKAEADDLVARDGESFQEELLALEQAEQAPENPPPKLPSRRDFRRMARKALSEEIAQLVLCVTENCNLRCAYCVYSDTSAGHRNHSPARMTWSTAKKAVDYLIRHSSRSLTPPAIAFYGGEPLLHPSLLRQVVEYATHATNGRARFVITTNGTRLDSDTRKWLVANDISLVVSVDGPQEIHDAYRLDVKRRPTFESIYANLVALSREAPEYFRYRVAFSVVVTSSDAYERLQSFFDTLNQPCIVTPVQNHGQAHVAHRTSCQTRIPFPDRQLLETFRSAVAQRSVGELTRHFVVSMLGADLGQIHSRSKRPGTVEEYLGQCVPGVRKVFVDATGNMYPCEKVDGNANLRIGHVDSGIDVEASLKILDEFRLLVKQRCGQCWLRGLCNSCISQWFHEGKPDMEKGDSYCAGRKSAAEKTLGLYGHIVENEPSLEGCLDQLAR